MIRGSLAARLEYAVLETVVQVFAGCQQDSWCGWRQQAIGRGVGQTEFADPDLLSAFKRLRDRGFLSLTKPDSHRRVACEYSGKQADDGSFFFNGRLNADVTDLGRSYWDSIREEPRRAIGFSRES